MELLCVKIIILINFRAGKLSQLGEKVGKAVTGFKKSLHDAVEEAVPQSAEPCMALSESIQTKGTSLGKQSLPLHVKDKVGEDRGSKISRQE